VFNFDLRLVAGFLLPPPTPSDMLRAKRFSKNDLRPNIIQLLSFPFIMFMKGWMIILLKD